MRDQLVDIGVNQVQVQPLGVHADQFHPRLRSDQLRRELHLDRDTLEKTLRYVTQNADGLSLDDLTAEAGEALVVYLRQRVEQARADAANEPVEEVLEGVLEDGDA